MFLTQEQLEDLTGAKKRGCQIEWLSKRGWPFEISRLGKVKVLSKYVEMQMGMPSDGKIGGTTAPDFSRI